MDFHEKNLYLYSLEIFSLFRRLRRPFHLDCFIVPSVACFAWYIITFAHTQSDLLGLLGILKLWHALKLKVGRLLFFIQVWRGAVKFVHVESWPLEHVMFHKYEPLSLYLPTNLTLSVIGCVILLHSKWRSSMSGENLKLYKTVVGYFPTWTEICEECYRASPVRLCAQSFSLENWLLSDVAIHEHNGLSKLKVLTLL